MAQVERKEYLDLQLQESVNLQSYKTSISQERWAVGNDRIQTLIKEKQINITKERPSWERSVNTHTRLGFGEKEYKGMDLVGSNPICRS